MAEELQHLLDRIQKEAVETAEKETGQIIAKAKQDAVGILKDAETKAAAYLTKAEQDAKVFVERGAQTLQQAARDLLLSVGQGVEKIIAAVVAQSVEQALKPDVLAQMLVKLAEAYAARQGAEGRVEILLAEQDRRELSNYFAAQTNKELLRGIELQVGKDVTGGFQLSLSAVGVRHDFTREAIAAAMADFLRPRLAEIVHQVARESVRPERSDEA